jgi:endonuclease/exonuclease/phosphatase family metal-dependent hydrolase
MTVKPSFLHKLLYLFNVLFALLLLIAYVLPFIEPTLLKSFAAVSLITPLLILVNLTFVVFWLLKMKRRVFLSTIVLLIGFTNLTRFYKLSGRKVILTDDIKVMSYNVRMFNKYRWINQDSIKEQINAFILEKAPDVICFQEFAPNETLKTHYPHVYEVYNSTSKHFGHAIYSKYPIVSKGSLNFEKTANNILYADIKIKQDTIRVYNMHLESLKISKKLERIDSEEASFLRHRISTAFQKQQKQVEVFLQHQHESQYPVILAGDFNNTAFSWPYRQLLKGKKDAFVEAGKGFDKTYDFKPFPMRIDFILVDESIKINHFKTYRDKFSDHYPIMTRLGGSSLKKE